MIKYEIIHNHEAERLVKDCVSFLHEHKITELPVLRLGERRTIFTDDRVTISLKSDGDRQGQFIVKTQQGEILTLSNSAKFRY